MLARTLWLQVTDANQVSRYLYPDIQIILSVTSFSLSTFFPFILASFAGTLSPFPSSRLGITISEPREEGMLLCLEGSDWHGLGCMSVVGKILR